MEPCLSDDQQPTPAVVDAAQDLNNLINSTQVQQHQPTLTAGNLIQTSSVPTAERPISVVVPTTVTTANAVTLQQQQTAVVPQIKVRYFLMRDDSAILMLDFFSNIENKKVGNKLTILLKNTISRERH